MRGSLNSRSYTSVSGASRVRGFLAKLGATCFEAGLLESAQTTMSRTPSFGFAGTG